MKPSALITSAIGLALFLFFQSPFTRAEDVAPDLKAPQADAQQAAKDIDAANKDAQANLPNNTVKSAEDKLDEAARKNEDTPANDPNKADTQKAEDDAKAKADDAQSAFGQGKDYRKALEKRREARKRLKKARDDLGKVLQKRRQSPRNDNSDVEKAVNEADKARRESEKKPERTATGMVMPQGQPTLAMLASLGKVKVDSNGTGETIGHIADLVIQNLTDQPLMCVVPPMILESGSGKNQHYACPKGQNVALNPHQEKMVPMDGVCVNRNKPPVGKGVSGDLLVNEGNPNIAQDPQSHLKAKDADKLLRIATSKYDAADKLQKDGTFKDLPYHDKQKQKDIVVQWSTWTDPQISEITGAPPATKEDLKKVVYKQVEQNGPMTPETKKKVDQGIDTIFEKVELTTAKAKDLEKPDTFAAENSGESFANGGVNVSDNTPAPPPQTQEKVPKKWPKPIQDWVDKKKKADKANWWKKLWQDDYKIKRYSFFLRSKRYRELVNEKQSADTKKAEAGPRATQEDQDKCDKADKELKKLEGELDKDFQQSPEGREEAKGMSDSEKAADKASAAEKEAGKNIDPATKEAVAVEEAERDKKAAETEQAERDKRNSPNR
jgi:hypothetical protein